MHQQTEVNALVDHLFRHESARILAVLTRIFGPENLELAEDVMQDSLVEAIKQWLYIGIPDNPSGWLFKVAKNKALNIVNRGKYQSRYTSDIVHLLRSEWTAEPAIDFIFTEEEISDDLLRMMFTCCHPSISSDSQIALILKTLCGFSIAEIARAFFTGDENIHKRLVRAKQKLRESRIRFEIPAGRELPERLQTVLDTIFLLFNEGYSASAGTSPIRYEICEEAIRLTESLALHAALREKADIFALLALMQLNACRFKARLDGEGQILTLAEQERSLWDFGLMKAGFVNLEKSMADREYSRYHILALISSCHCSARDFESTDWSTILSLYDRLLAIDDTPIVRLNRAVAVGKVHGAAIAISELEKISGAPELESYHLFYSVRAEFYMELNQLREAAVLLQKAIYLAPLIPEKNFLQKKLTRCTNFL